MNNRQQQTGDERWRPVYELQKENIGVFTAVPTPVEKIPKIFLAWSDHCVGCLCEMRNISQIFP